MPSLEINMIGREAELTRLEELCHRSAENGCVVALVAGEAGVGKTLLVETLLERCRMPHCMGRSHEAITPPYGPITAILRECFHRKLIKRDSDTSIRRFLSMLMPELGDIPVPGDRETLIEAVADVFAEVSRKAGLVLVFDDVQWADNATFEMLPMLVEKLSQERLLIIGTYRSDDIPRSHPIRRLRSDLRRTRRLREITVGPLARQHVHQVASSTFGHEPDESLSRLIFDHSQGIPLYVEELCQALTEGNFLETTGDKLRLVAGAALPVPEGIRDTVLLRLETISKAARELVDVAAIAGVDFDLKLITEIAGTDRGIEELLDRRFIQEQPGGRGEFRHALVREAVKHEITWSRARELHRRIGEYLVRAGASPEQTAEHWLAANEHKLAREALIASADHSCRVHAYRDAARAAHRALEIWPVQEEEEQRLETLERLAHCAVVSGQLNDAAKAWREVIDSPRIADQHWRLGMAWRELATVLGLQGVWESAIDARRKASVELERADLPAEAAIESLTAGGRLLANLRFDEALSATARTIDLAREAQRVDLEARAMGLEGEILSMQGDFDEAHERARAGLALALKHDEINAASDVHRRLAATLTNASKYATARDAYVTALDFCRTQGEQVHAKICLSCLTYVLFQTADWRRATEVCKEVLDSPESPEGSRATALGAMALIRIHRGEIKQGKALIRQALAEARRLSIPLMEMLVLWGRALLNESMNDIEGATTDYNGIIDYWQRTLERHDIIPALTCASTFFARRKDAARTTQCVEALAAIASATGNPEALAALAHALGEAAFLQKEFHEAAAQFQQALKHLDSLELPIARIRTELRAGESYALIGDTEHAIALLKKAYSAARNLGARPLASQSVAALERLGETPTERRSPEADSRAPKAGLTRRQLEIARLMADGLTNKEIAERLFLSPRTVDMHVANILNRLDSRSRTEAVRKAAELGLL